MTDLGFLLPPGDVPTRGERDLNPGNLNYGGGWRGELGPEIVPPGENYTPRFGRYDTAEHGIRAIAGQLLAYQDRDKLMTIREFINRWAPPSDDNETDAYVFDVANGCGMSPDVDCNLHWAQLLIGIVTGIIRHENGRCLYPATLIATACQDALRSAPLPPSNLTS